MFGSYYKYQNEYLFISISLYLKLVRNYPELLVINHQNFTLKTQIHNLNKRNNLN